MLNTWSLILIFGFVLLVLAILKCGQIDNFTLAGSELSCEHICDMKYPGRFEGDTSEERKNMIRECLIGCRRETGELKMARGCTSCA